jgi:hypothetical protein
MPRYSPNGAHIEMLHTAWYYIFIDGSEPIVLVIFLQKKREISHTFAPEKCELFS